MSQKIGQLSIYDPHRSSRVGEILIQPASEQNEADLFILVEIDSNNQEDYQLIQQFLTIAYQVYEKSRLRQTENVLENILQNLNNELKEIIPKKLDWPKKFHCFIGLVANQTVYFTVTGKIKVFLIKPTLIKNIAEKTPEENTSSIFDYTMTGKLKTGDRLLVTTESLTDYISLEKIKKIVSTLPPQSSIAHLTNILEGVPPSVPFFSFIIQMMGQKSSFEEIKINNNKKSIISGSKNSLDQLLKTQAETEKILTPPSLVDVLKDHLKQTPEKIKQTARSKAKKKNITIHPHKTNRPIKSVSLLFNIINKIISTIKNIWQFLTQIQFRKILLNKLTYKLTGLVKQFGQLSKTNKILFILAVVFILLFSQSLIWQEKRMEHKKINEEYNIVLSQIAEKHSAIEASLIYNDTIRAKQLINETSLLLNNLPQTNKEQIAKAIEITDQIQILFEQIWKITNILDPISLINFREINLTTEVSELGFKDDTIYGFNNTDQVFAINTENNQTMLIENFHPKTVQAELMAEKNLLMIRTEDNKFYSLNNNEIQELTASLPAELKQIDYTTFYLDKMYILDRQSKQIFRLTYIDNSFSRARAWIKEDLPLDKTVSLSVDGAIYTLQADGHILKLSSGQSQIFPKLIIEPEFLTPTKIYTTDQSDNLYILDPQNQRFVIITKTGELKRQYYSDQFTNLKDFIIKENDKKVFLLNGAQVFVVAI